MRADKKPHLKSEKKTTARSHKRGVVGYSKKTALLDEAITQMNAGKYGRSSAALKELLALEPLNMEARRLFATLHLRLGSLIPARQAFDSLINEAFERQDYWLAESLLREYLAAGPRCVPFLKKLGALFEEKGDALEAVAEYGKAIDILIEDPDTDNPRHAAQLYAKIRDLAPASPVAFRLASFFDAQTGELIARPAAVAHTEGQATHSLDMLTGIASEPSAPAIPELVTGVMPWEQVEDRSPEPAVATDALQESGHQTELVHPSQSLDPVETLRADELIVASPSEINAEPACRVLDDDTGEAHHSVAISPVSSMAAEDATIGPSEPEAPLPLVADLVPPGSRQDPEPLLPQAREAAIPESISAPMPWEDVQESTINIPEHVADDLPPPSAQVEESQASTPYDHASSSESRDEPIAVPPMSVGAEPSPSVSSICGPSATVPSSSLADTTSSPPLPDMSKGGFSWDSVFDSAWKFGDKFLSGPPVPQGENKTELHSTSQAAPIAPMPWDQVQETIVMIPPAEVEATVEEVPEAATAPLPILEDAASAPAETVVSPTPAVAGEESFSITQLPAVPPAAEPEFRFLGKNVEQVIDAGHPAEGEVQLSSLAEPGIQTDQIQAESPVAAYEEVHSILPVDVQASQLQGEMKHEEVEASSFVADLVPALAREGPLESMPLQAVEPLSDSDREDQVEQTSLSAEPPMQPSTIAPALSIDEPVSSGEGALQRPQNEEPLHLSEEHDRSVQAEPSVEHVQPRPVAGGSAPTESTETASSIPIPSNAQPAIESASISQGNPSHWSTGEVAVQTHRSTPKKPKRGVAPSTEPTPVVLSEDEQVKPKAIVRRREEPHVLPEEAGSGESVSQPVQQPDEWIRTGESIRFIKPEVPQSMEPVPQIAQPVEVAPTLSSAAVAVDVLFESSGRMRRTETRERERAAEPRQRPRLRVKLARTRIAISLFISSCFSTTRAMVISVVALLLLSGALMALAVGAVGLLWTILEERPSSAFQSLTTIPQRTLSDPKKNGYVLALGFDARAGQDPFQIGYERKPQGKDTDLVATCMGGPSGGPRGGQTNASARVASGWFQGSDPVAQFKMHQDTIKGWAGQAEAELGRYKQWLKLPFEDWGYGQSVSPPCGSILFAHQLYLADGFVQGVDTGIDRLETDMDAWRIVLGQAKTLPVKTMALEAINNDIAVASGLLVSTDFDGRWLGRLTKMLRPLDQVELSIRWPMQSELVAASKTFEAQMKADRNEELPLHVVVASALPLPKQRRFNDYADYYEASYKAAGEGRYGSLPKWGHYIHFPATTLVDYLMNPIENIVGLEPLPAWDRYNGMVVDTDARLRLASLQAWLRRGPQDADLLARIAKAGQSAYDPYTGLPMLVNLKKGVMYSVGHDGKDQDADPQTDIVAFIPLSQSSAISQRAASSKSK